MASESKQKPITINDLEKEINNIKQEKQLLKIENETIKNKLALIEGTKETKKKGTKIKEEQTKKEFVIDEKSLQEFLNTITRVRTQK